MTTNVFPTAQQLADMLLASNPYDGASIAIDEECRGTYFISLTVKHDDKRFYDGFWYTPEYAAEGEFYSACKHFAEICDAVHEWTTLWY